jgi:asparagine synthase (glutamine-hydrolysing)
LSGFAGLVGAAGAPVDPDVVAGLADAIAYCGPDRQGSWRGDGAALAHALLRTTEEDAGDRQPVSFDGRVWLVADARVDARKPLLGALGDAGRDVGPGAPDNELILHAYHAWGEACVERLIGDFAFAVWDAGRRKLFCARDQFGVTPFYYAAAGEWLVFADAVEAVLSHPGVDPALNRSTIGDYLLFGYSKEPGAGFYKNVRRLPAAHCLIFENGAARVRRYWTPPEPDPRPGRETEADTVERFRGILAEAVSDRLRWPKVATTLSGGMDSTLVTGFALRQAPAGCRIDAYSSGCNWLLPDQERYWAHVCATHLGAPFHAVNVEDHLLTPSDGEYWRRVPSRGSGCDGCPTRPCSPRWRRAARGCC